MTKHVHTTDRLMAWMLVEKYFPTDYMKDEEASLRAGYPVYVSTAAEYRSKGYHISDLNTRLEINMESETIMIWIDDSKERIRKSLANLTKSLYPNKRWATSVAFSFAKVLCEAQPREHAPEAKVMSKNAWDKNVKPYANI